MTFRLTLLSLCLAACGAFAFCAEGEITVKGALQCGGMCSGDEKDEHDVLVMFAVDGSPEIVAKVKKIMDELYPEKGLDADAAQKVQEVFVAQLKFYIAKDSTGIPALYGGGQHYCNCAQPYSITGVVTEKDGKKWLKGSHFEQINNLKYPEKMLMLDKPFVAVDKTPLVLKINDKLSLNCLKVPAGKVLLGAPFYMAIRYHEEYPHQVTLTKPFYMAEIPVTQEIYEAVMGNNPSVLKDPKVPAQNPPFAEMDRFCKLLSEKTGRKVRLPSAAEWEYTARCGTSNPPFPDKYNEQNSRGNQGWKAVLPVKSKKPNGWGFYDMASCWWEITCDKASYPSRSAQIDPRDPASGKAKRVGMGIPQEHWTFSMREFEDETGLGYCFNKFRIAVDVEPTDPK